MRIPVIVTTAVLKLSPFRWISFVQALPERTELDSVEDDPDQVKQEFEDMVGSSASLQRVLRQAEVVAPTDANVSSSGKPARARNWWRAPSIA